MGHRGVKVLQKRRAFLNWLICFQVHDYKIEVSMPLAQILDLPLLKLHISLHLYKWKKPARQSTLPFPQIPTLIICAIR